MERKEGNRIWEEVDLSVGIRNKEQGTPSPRPWFSVLTWDPYYYLPVTCVTGTFRESNQSLDFIF